MERLNRNKQGSGGGGGGGGFMESLLRQDKPEPKNGLELNEEDKLINNLPEKSNVEKKDEHLGKRLKKLR